MKFWVRPSAVAYWAETNGVDFLMLLLLVISIGAFEEKWNVDVWGEMFAFLTINGYG